MVDFNTICKDSGLPPRKRLWYAHPIELSNGHVTCLGSPSANRTDTCHFPADLTANMLFTKSFFPSAMRLAMFHTEVHPSARSQSEDDMEQEVAEPRLWQEQSYCQPMTDMQWWRNKPLPGGSHWALGVTCYCSKTCPVVTDIELCLKMLSVQLGRYNTPVRAVTIEGKGAVTVPKRNARSCHKGLDGKSPRNLSSHMSWEKASQNRMIPNAYTLLQVVATNFLI